MKLLVVVATATLFAAGLSTPAYADEAAFKAAGCAKCHDPDKKKKGAPAIKELQEKYKGDKGKVNAVTAAVSGGKDHPEIDAKGADVKKAVSFAIGVK